MSITNAIAELTDRPLFLELIDVPGLDDDWWRVSVFDWSALSEEERDIAVESHLLVYKEKHGAAWLDRYVPFAWLGGENHPVEELDEQIDGTLVIDREGGAVLLASPDSMSGELHPFASSFASLAFRDERPE